jgi:hypothetical protein
MGAASANRNRLDLHIRGCGLPSRAMHHQNPRKFRGNSKEIPRKFHAQAGLKMPPGKSIVLI